MKKNEILAAIRSLSMSQGFYGRLYRFLTDGSDDAERYIADLEKQNLKDAVDLVMYIEC